MVTIKPQFLRIVFKFYKIILTCQYFFMKLKYFYGGKIKENNTFFNQIGLQMAEILMINAVKLSLFNFCLNSFKSF